ncbi:hypothetical protein [Azospirillum brasilense]|uniref:hypothetical protein n=1 Tax=Azospirillum brasilense TaxID=192 RepID=UPI00157B828C|nr:hypothetical protein [Azospirillum brasilense]
MLGNSGLFLLPPVTPFGFAVAEPVMKAGYVGSAFDGFPHVRVVFPVRILIEGVAGVQAARPVTGNIQIQDGLLVQGLDAHDKVLVFINEIDIIYVIVNKNNIIFVVVLNAFHVVRHR